MNISFKNMYVGKGRGNNFNLENYVAYKFTIQGGQFSFHLLSFLVASGTMRIILQTNKKMQ